MGSKRLSELCEIIGQHGFPAQLYGQDSEVCAVNTLEDAQEGEVSFLSNPKYIPDLKKTKASAVIVNGEIDVPDHLVTMRCDDPYAAVTVSIIVLHGYRQHPQWGRSESATIHPSATIGAEPNIAPGVTIAADAVIGDRCTMYPGVFIGDGARLGSDCTLFPNVVVYDGSVVGNRVTIHAASVVGQDGVGYAPQGDKWLKIPQVGRAVIHDDVEIGANCSIDRATLGRTEIGPGTKFGNGNVVGHGARIGADCMFVGQIGIAGSAKVGRHVTLAGQVGVAGHIKVGDNTTVGAKSGLYRSVPAESTLLGLPALPVEEARRDMLVSGKLPDCIRRIKQLEREVAELRARLDGNGS